MIETDDNLEYVSKNQLDDLIGFNTYGEQSGIFDAVYSAMTDPCKPDWVDLVRIHRFIQNRRVTTSLDFGCEDSTLLIDHALRQNRNEYGESNLRRGNPFQTYVVDDMPEYVEMARNQILTDLKSLVHLAVSRVNMNTFAGRVRAEYEILPNICPDFFYPDDPSQHSTRDSISGISTTHSDRLPMACHILKIEHFLLPGTLILVDGRTANARFMKLNLRRNWKFEHDRSGDFHTFELCESPHGPYNLKQVDLCLGENWSAHFG